ncbi:hypothetical protein Tco_1243244 [Tanacetum coccineum]
MMEELLYNQYRGGNFLLQQGQVGPTLQEQVEDDLWFKDKVLLVQAQANGQILHKEELAFLADLGTAEDTLAEVHNTDNMDNNMINQDVQVIPSSKQSNVVNHSETEITSFQNPFYLKKAQQLKPKLYVGNVIKNTSAIVITDFEETLVLAEESHPTPSCRPTKVEVTKELPKASMVNTSLKKLKHHLAGFDVVVKERTMATAITEGS